MIEKFLNIKNSLRELSDCEFEEVLPTLANELSNIDYITTYSREHLLKDWSNLKKLQLTRDTSSSVRTGMKLCEHFFPNFYDIRSKGKEYSKLWKDTTLLQKILRWNRKGHSTPYLSELKRGIYFCGGLTKSTMFRPHLAKLIACELTGHRLLDPCCGWGGRLLGTISSGMEYVGFEPNYETYSNLIKLVDFLGIDNRVTIINDVFENSEKYNIGLFDIILTSPPYFNLEVYSDNPRQSENLFDSYDNWKTGWLEDVIYKASQRLTPRGISCWNVHNIGKMKMIQDVEEIHNKLGFRNIDSFILSSSKRPTNGKGKSKDITNCYSK